MGFDRRFCHGEWKVGSSQDIGFKQAFHRAPYLGGRKDTLCVIGAKEEDFAW